MAGAVAVAGVAGHVRTFHCFTGAAALDRGRVDQPEVVVPRRAVPGERGDDVLHRCRGVTEPLVVGGALRQVREQPQMDVA